MSALHKAIIEAIVYLATTQGSDAREDDDIRAIESIIAELSKATWTDLNDFVTSVRSELEQCQNPAKIDALESLIESLSA